MRPTPRFQLTDHVVLRRWRVKDARAQDEAVRESLDHLRPFMPWAAHEPSPMSARRDRLRR